MLDDLNIPIGAIRPYGKSLKEQILDIQRFRSRRYEAHVWAAKLRFLKVGSNGGIPAVGDTSSPNISEDSANQETVDQGRASLGSVDGENDSSADSVSKSSTEEPCLCDLIPPFQKGYEYPSLELTSADLLAGCRHYVAVSYCWSTSEERQAETGKTYTIETAQGPRANKAPSAILDRAIAYAAEYGLGLIWIDQECIDQDDRDDKENGIQSMDLVYERATHPVGLLKHHIDSQAHLDVMELLAQGAPCRLEHFDAMVEVLEILRDDRWFSRTWCLQEATSAGGDMDLLLPCDRHLLKIQDTALGNSEDAIEFTIFALQTSTAWALGCLEDNIHEMDEEMAARWRKVAEHLDELYPASSPPGRVPCNAAQALFHMAGRRNSRIADRVAILSNMCNYKVKLDTRQLESDLYSLSVCCLTLSLLNGDFSYIHTGKLMSGDTWEDSDAFSWCPSPSSSLASIKYVEEFQENYIFRDGGYRIIQGRTLVQRMVLGN